MQAGSPVCHWAIVALQISSWLVQHSTYYQEPTSPLQHDEVVEEESSYPWAQLLSASTNLEWVEVMAHLSCFLHYY